MAGGQEMICPRCHGNGYLIEQLRALRQVRQCETCHSQGEIKEFTEQVNAAALGDKENI